MGLMTDVSPGLEAVKVGSFFVTFPRVGVCANELDITIPVSDKAKKIYLLSIAQSVMSV